MFRLDHEGEVARLTLDRPAARNAIALGGWHLFAERLAEIERSSARLLVLCGDGGAFCAGADLGDFPLLARDESERIRFRVSMRNALDKLAALPIPTIALVEGACYGAGVALAMACDIRLAGPGARFAITPAKIGISYPQEDVHRLVALVGSGQASRLLFGAASIDDAEANRIGLVEGDVAAEADLVAAILSNSGESIAALKQSIRLASEGRRSHSDQDQCFDALIAGPDLTRRLEALRRK